MYYAIVEFMERWPEAKVQRLLAKWDRRQTLISQHFNLADRPGEVPSPTQIDYKPGDKDPDPDSLAAQLTRQVGVMMVQGN